MFFPQLESIDNIVVEEILIDSVDDLQKFIDNEEEFLLQHISNLD
jgi:hypothetical protein